MASVPLIIWHAHLIKVCKSFNKNVKFVSKMYEKYGQQSLLVLKYLIAYTLLSGRSSVTLGMNPLCLHASPTKKRIKKF